MEPFEPFRKDLLSGKTTVITGGGSGLGKSMALRMGGLGARVAVLGRRPEPLEETAKAIRDGGGHAVGVSCAERDPEPVAKAIAAVE
jgi:NAD(P)-dependent dehydrogenase (short-subunit alcohol dehydrogenase family)